MCKLFVNSSEQCLTVRAMPWLSRTATNSSRTAHGEFTGSSQLVDTVHEQFIGAVVTLLLNIPEMTSEETSYITETTF